MHARSVEGLRGLYFDSEGLRTELGESLEAAMGKEEICLIRTELSEYTGQYGH